MELRKVLYKYLEKNKQSRQAKALAAEAEDPQKERSPKKKILLKTLSKELLDCKKWVGPGLEADPRAKQVLNVQVSKFGESPHPKKHFTSFECEDKWVPESFLNNLSFGKA